MPAACASWSACCCPAHVGYGFIALGVGLPGLMLQDSYRFAFFSAGRGGLAFVNDTVWGVIACSRRCWRWSKTDRADAVTCILAFGGTATLAAGLGFVQCRVLPRPQAVRGWLLDHRDLGGRYLIENVEQRRCSPAADGRGGRHRRAWPPSGRSAPPEILMGPLLIIVSGVSQVAVPEIVAVAAAGDKAGGRLLPVDGGGPGAWLPWCGPCCITVMFPRGLGDLLLGELWVPAAELVPPVGDARSSLAASRWRRRRGCARWQPPAVACTAQVSSSAPVLLARRGRSGSWAAPRAPAGAPRQPRSGRSVLWSGERASHQPSTGSHSSASPRGPPGGRAAAGSPSTGRPRRSEPHPGRR